MQNHNLSSNFLDNIQIVLVEPSHLGNVGSAARAMKTMGLTHLAVVTDKDIITPESMALAKGAQDVLQAAMCYPSLNGALADSAIVAGTSARNRSVELPLYQPKEAVEHLAPHIIKGCKCSVVFGRERTGLTNEELLKCDLHINIDANPEYSSLNLAMSVQVLSYELRQHLITNMQDENFATNVKQLMQDRENFAPKPKHEDLESYYAFLEQNLIACGFLKGEHNENVLAQLRKIYAKADLTAHELQILYGTTASMIRHAVKIKA